MDHFKTTKYRNLEEAARDVRESMERVWSEARALGLNHPLESFKARDRRKADEESLGDYLFGVEVTELPAADTQGRLEVAVGNAAHVTFQYGTGFRSGVALGMKRANNGHMILTIRDDDREDNWRSFTVALITDLTVRDPATGGQFPPEAVRDHAENLSERIVDAVEEAFGVDTGTVAVPKFISACTAVDAILIAAEKAK